MRVMPKNNLQVTSHQSLVTNHQKRNRFRDSLFLFLESAVKFHFPFAAGGAVSAPAAASTAADGGMIDVTAGKNEEDGDHRHHSIDCGIHGYLLFMSLLIFHNNESDEFCYLAADPMGGRLRRDPSLMRRMASLSAQSYACAPAPSAAGFSFGAGRQMK